MEMRTLGTTEIQITPILMGTWQAGKEMWVGIEDAETVRAIRAAYEAGITTVDTAEVYGEGHSEHIVAQALSDVRDRVVYVSKVFANHLKGPQVIEACERSLRNLSTDYLDLYQIHWPAGSFKSERVPIAGARNAQQAEDNAKAANLKLSAADLVEMDRISQSSRSLTPSSLIWR